MVDVLLLHSALGLRSGVRHLEKGLTAAGLTVLAPDFYAGQVFDDVAEGIAHRDAVGARELFRRLGLVLDQLPARTALMGISLGAAFAQRLAVDRPEAAAVVLLHYAVAPPGPWPGQPVQVHRHASDPFIEEPGVVALRRAVLAAGATFEDIVVPGAGHLYTDPELSGYDAGRTQSGIRSIVDLLARTMD